ncbi:DUF4097 family beta strand repeat protein [Streptomyces sp. PKU-EA00015]|uniref:DUF4097 family beta strand repeat-containing protein n=1 Tax=Streptomyces sp. PKU-EA00015 TaxID=2748326 RepID=UPI0015A45C43|nr:DUF4097 family beta strand repeat-containing protein [Streptomyces sp. PKU-EA00015]NWF27480.1 DUF4097 family beta strand repeat protein [Streptomyces sp. PKU-EA00015]
MSVIRHRPARVALAGVAVLVGILGVSGCGSADAKEAPVERKAFAFGGKALTIDADDSALEIVPADIDDVRVTRQVDGWVMFGSGPSASWGMRDGTLTLEVTCEAVASDCEARHSVKVPRDVAVTVVDDNGSVTADGFTTPLKITSDNGSVTVRDSSGPLTLGSDNGSIVTERVTSRTVTATSDNGSVRLGLGAVPERVETVSDNGRIDIELPASGAPYAVRAESRNGDVDIAVPTDDDSRHIVTARSDNGKVVVRSMN